MNVKTFEQIQIDPAFFTLEFSYIEKKPGDTRPSRRVVEDMLVSCNGGGICIDTSKIEIGGLFSDD